jgi:hypothetical protein
MRFLPFKISASTIYIHTKLSYQEAKNLYIKSKKKAKNINELIDILIELAKPEPISQTCAICLEDIHIKDKNNITLECSHHYHSSCFREYYLIHMNKTCSICRSPFKSEVKLNKTRKKKYANKILGQLNKSKNRRREILDRYEFYKSLNLEFQFLTDLYKTAVKLPPMPDLSDSEDESESGDSEDESESGGDTEDDSELYLHMVRINGDIYTITSDIQHLTLQDRYNILRGIMIN